MERKKQESPKEEIVLNRLKEVITIKRLLELVSMLVLYVLFDAGGAMKYAAALLFCAIFLFLGRKKQWSYNFSKRNHRA